ncbi:hypothetical protein DVH05_016940 [Phytophthora capsici]|nr:hypothetical protein DVH05_016940 [Phytophthora capsici]
MGRGRTRNRISRGTTSSNEIKAKPASVAGIQQTPNTKEATRTASVSPKRKAPDTWRSGHTVKKAGRTADGQEEDKPTGTRSLSPLKTRKAHPRGGRRAMDTRANQSFIHQYMPMTKARDSVAVATQQDLQPTEERGVTDANAAKELGDIEPQHANPVHMDELMEEDEEGTITHIVEATDQGETLETWLALLGGILLDVAANGYCG